MQVIIETNAVYFDDERHAIVIGANGAKKIVGTLSEEKWRAFQNKINSIAKPGSVVVTGR